MKVNAKSASAAVLTMAVTMAMAVPAPASAAVTFFQAYLSINNHSYAQGAGGWQETQSQDFVSTSTFPAFDMIVAADADSRAKGGLTLQAQGHATDIATLHLDSPSAGSISHSSNSTATVLANGQTARAETYGFTANYFFYVGVDSVFHYNLSTTSTQNQPSTVFRLRDEFGSALFDQNYGENVSSSGSIALPASPLLYYIDFFRAPGATDVSQTGLGSKSASATNLFSFSITAVPEPSTWALMIGGFGLAGAALRRRPAGLATA